MVGESYDERIAKETSQLLLSIFDSLLEELQQCDTSTLQTSTHRSKQIDGLKRQSFEIMRKISVIVGESVLLDAFTLATTESVRRVQEKLYNRSEHELVQTTSTQRETSPDLYEDFNDTTINSAQGMPILEVEVDRDKEWVDALNGTRTTAKKILQLYQVNESPRSAMKLTLYRNYNWCSCLFYENEVLKAQKRWSCPHWVALRLAESMEMVVVEETNPEQIKQMIISSFCQL